MAAPVVAIVGQTASGKSDLAMRLAGQFDGEIICADSRTIYKGMDIGTAKPSEKDQQLVPHHGLDLITPNEYFSAAAFKDLATSKVNDIQKRGRLPIIVGGTGLYIDGFIYNYNFQAPVSSLTRSELEALSLHELHERARALGIDEGQTDYKNYRHLSRAVERGNINPERHPLPENVLIIGLKIEAEQLKERIARRVDTMFDMGFVKESQNLISIYGADAPGLLTPGYKAALRYISGEITLETAKEEFRRNDKHLAKRQMTWFKRNLDIIWVQSDVQAIQVVKTFLPGRY